MITSNTNAKIKNVVKLLSASKARKEQGLFVVEGEKLFMEAPLERIESVFVSQGFFNKVCGQTDCLDKLDQCGYETVTDAVYHKMSDTTTPQGILCTIKGTQYSYEDLICDTGPQRILLLEGIQDPGNMGTMLRTAEAAGYDAIIADHNTVDFYNPKAIRSTMGAIFRAKVAYCPDIQEAIKLAKENGVTVYAAHLRGEAYYHEVRYADKTAIIIGNESKGLREETSQLADILVKIPMKGQAESLNAAVAAAILMYESIR